MRWIQRQKEQYQLVSMLPSIQWQQEHPIPFTTKTLSLALFAPERHAQLTLQVWRQKLFEKGNILVPFFLWFHVFYSQLASQHHCEKWLSWVIDLVFPQQPFTDKGSNKDRAKEDKKEKENCIGEMTMILNEAFPCIHLFLRGFYHLPSSLF